jgi:serine/threonine-protein kinase
LLPDSRTLGRYRLLALLGQGGMADVYLATSHGKNGFTKLLVVKELRMLLANQPEFLDMFLDEARLAARLNHPNVVQTYEIESDGSRHFIGMEYLDGQPLSRVLSEFAERGGMPLVGYLRVLTEALSGLHYAHELTDFDGTALEVVHRDVTPHNIFVTYEGQVKLVDFGIAKAVDSSAETRVGLLKGKVGYLSPEQARGEKLDRRSDVYSAGVILWEMIARRRMWRANPDVVVLNRLAAGDVPDIAEANAQVPPELARICARALAFKVDDRYPTADALRGDLEGFLSKQADVLDTRAVGAIILDAFRDERSQLRAVVRETLRDTSLLPSPDSGSMSTRARSETPASSRAVVSVTGPGSGSIHEAKTAVLRVSPPRSKLPPVIFGVALLVAGIGAFAWVKAHLDPRREELTAPDRHALTRDTAERGLPPPAPLSNANGCGARDKPLVELTGDIDDDARLTCDKSYLLKFNVVVRPGST